METSLKKHLKQEDYDRLKKILHREPTNIEIVLAVALWNEHCSYRSSRIHLKKFQFPTKKKVSAIGENAGIVDLGRGERVAFKMESHNHPSYIIPYHGAATGVGGILRDVFAMNARPLILADYLCFGDPKTAKNNSWRVDQVIRGIGNYGNSMGIPTLNGQTEFSECYNGNILVNAMALGFLGSQDKPMDSKATGVGNYVVYVGSATGRDGVLGASMASSSFGEKEADKPTVQIGDPFFGKQLMEACLLAMKKNLVLACQDMGAAGLTCSSFEMAEKGEVGLKIQLDQVPLRDSTMTPEDILLSESQERMLFICKPSCWKSLKKIFDEFELEVCIIGEVLATKDIQLYWSKKCLLKVEPQLFTSGAPIENRPYQIPEPAHREDPSKFSLSETSLNQLLIDILKSPNGRSRRFIYEQYDQKVGTQTVQDSSCPLSVIRLPESQRELAVALGCRVPVMETDIEQGSKDSIFFPALELALRGFTPWAVTDCLNFGNPEKPDIMGQFVLSVETLAQSCKILDTPIISGNVSFYNESQEVNITPTPSVAMVGLKENNNPIPKSYFTKNQDRVYLVYSHQFWFPGSAQKFFSKKEQQAFGGLQDELLHLFIHKIKDLQERVPFSSSKLVGKFGLSYALARMVLEGGVGFCLDSNFKLALLGERLYEVIISIPDSKDSIFKKEIMNLGLDVLFLGKTGDSKMTLRDNQWSIKELKDAYYCSWEDISL